MLATPDLIFKILLDHALEATSKKLETLVLISCRRACMTWCPCRFHHYKLSTSSLAKTKRTTFCSTPHAQRQSRRVIVPGADFERYNGHGQVRRFDLPRSVDDPAATLVDPKATAQDVVHWVSQPGSQSRLIKAP